MLSISSVAGHAWTLLAQQIPSNQPGLGSAQTKQCGFFRPDLESCMAQWTVTGATHHYNSFMDLCCPFQV
jgi:hypothetical protein